MALWLSTLGLLVSLSPPAREAMLVVTVVDPSGGVIPRATVTVRAGDNVGPTPDAVLPADAGNAATATTSDQGVATIAGLAPGRYTVRAEFAGFDAGILRDVGVRAGQQKRVTVTLPLQRVETSVTVGRDPQLAAADPRGTAFGTTLTRDEIDALSDDPAEFVRQLLEIAGGNALIRVDGFNGGTNGSAIPPKSIIKSIRVQRDRFAAEHHSPDFDEIEIVTQPGTGPLRGGGSWRWRDGALSGRTPFTTTTGPERTHAWQANAGGTLIRSKASFSLSAGGTSSFDTPILNVALPERTSSTPGLPRTRAALLDLRRPADSWNTYDLLDYALSTSQLLRVAYIHNTRTRQNLGVGGYDLPERAYDSHARDQELRLQHNGSLGTRVFATTRLGVQWSDARSRASVESPTVRVLDAFTSGGAQVAGSRHARELEFATDVDYVRGNHAVRAGLLIERARFRSDETSNYLGTYTFSNLAAFEAGQPASYTRRIGNPNVSYANLTAGAYLQDDFRIGKSLTLSHGVRYEVQTHVRDLNNVSPRVAATWAPFPSGRTTLRLSYGFFYEWLNVNTYEQTLRLDGFRQQELNIINPPYPFVPDDVTTQRNEVGTQSGAAPQGDAAPPTNRYVLAPDLTLATAQRLTFGIEQAFGSRMRAGLSYYINHDDGVLRGRNLNAPIDGTGGTRPDPLFANVIEAVPDAAFRGTQLEATLAINLAPSGRVARPPRFDWRRHNLRMSYLLSRQENNSDGPFSVPASGDLATEWGAAPFNRRHRVQASLTSQAIRNLSAVLSVAANTGTPYTITTGFDGNGDAIFNDRPAGVGRGTLRMPGQFTLSANLSYAVDLGRDSKGTRERCRLSWSVNAMNLTNRANYAGVSGVLTSPFFMRPTSVQNPRKVDVGMSVAF